MKAIQGSSAELSASMYLGSYLEVHKTCKTRLNDSTKRKQNFFVALGLGGLIIIIEEYAACGSSTVSGGTIGKKRFEHLDTLVHR